MQEQLQRGNYRLHSKGATAKISEKKLQIIGICVPVWRCPLCKWTVTRRRTV